MFTLLPASQYRGDSRIDEIQAPYAVMVAVLGEPNKNGEPGYPDDDSKTDVCWCIRSTERPESLIAFWNYKNGPAYNGESHRVEDIDSFSVWHNDHSFFWQVGNLIRNHTVEIVKTAPTIRAALEEMLRHYATGHEDNPEIKQARAALARACRETGRDT